MSNPSWKWLPSRPAARELAAAAGSDNNSSRPCLPAVEQLGDRIMMSADALGAVQPQALVNPPPQVSQILIGMMKGDTDLFAQDLATLKLAAGVDSKLAHKLANRFLKIDFAVYKFGQALIKGLPAESKHARAAETIDRQFLKIDEAVARLPADVQLKIAPSVDAVELKVDQVVAQLGTIGPAPVLAREDKTALLKITRDWGQMDAAAFKYNLALATNSSKVASQEELLKIKLSDVLISSANVQDATLKAEITNVVATAEQNLIGLQQPTIIDDVISG